MLRGTVRQDRRLNLAPQSRRVLDEATTDEWQESADQADSLAEDREDRLELRAGDEAVWVKGPEATSSND